MSATKELETLRWQFDLAKRLAAHHLPALTDEMCLWKPTANAWSVTPGPDGAWRPDWSNEEPHPAPATSIAWLTWHLIWWWSSLTGAVHSEIIPSRESVLWPGSATATIARIEALTADWSAMLQTLNDHDLDRPSAYPWPTPRPLRIALAWCNLELMKNVAEIGVVRRSYEAVHQTPL